MPPERTTVNARMTDEWSPNDCQAHKTFAWVSHMAHEIVWAKYMLWKARLRLPRQSKTIEAGCGYGKFSVLLGLSGETTTLLDYNKDALASASELHRWFHLEPRCESGDLIELSAKLRGQYDVACSFGVLEHFSGAQRLQAFQSTAEFVRPGGMVFVTVPNRFGFLYQIAVFLRRITGFIPRRFYEDPYSTAELRSIASAANIKILDVECIGSLRHDWAYWIGENVKSIMRRIFGMKRPAGQQPVVVDPASIDMSGSRIRDTRTYLDKRFSSVVLFVGQKQ